MILVVKHLGESKDKWGYIEVTKISGELVARCELGPCDSGYEPDDSSCELIYNLGFIECIIMLQYLRQYLFFLGLTVICPKNILCSVDGAS
jgi:hypothetical protein